MNCTIKDIAKDTGLSLATISKYLNEKPILPENQIIIERSIKKLEYVPNQNAQTLRTQRTHTVCILLPEIGDYFWGALCSHIEEYLQEYNYSTLISSYNCETDDNREDLKRLLSTQADGAIFIPQNVNKVNLPTLMSQAKIPFIYLDQVSTIPEADSVTSTNCQSSYEATEYIIRQGHRRIGLIGGTGNSYTTVNRIKGFQEACCKYNISKKDQLIRCGDFSSQSGAALFHELMKLGSPPTAILILGYNLTLGAIQELHYMKINVPDDLSIITFDDDEIFSAYQPPITAVAQNLKEIGRQSAKLLMRRIKGDYAGFPNILQIPTDLIKRNSVKKI